VPLRHSDDVMPIEGLRTSRFEGFDFLAENELPVPRTRSAAVFMSSANGAVTRPSSMNGTFTTMTPKGRRRRRGRRCGRMRRSGSRADRRTPASTGVTAGLAGVPATITKSATSCVTTAPATTKAPLPIVIPHRNVALAPIVAPSFTRVISNGSRRGKAARGRRTLVKTAFGPTKTSDSRRTPS
jgi:hypothetical protein